MVNYNDNLEKCDWGPLVWHQKHTIRYSIFFWMAIMQSFKTVDNLSYRHIYIKPICPLYNLDFKSISHLLFECNYSFCILIMLIPSFKNFLLRPNLYQYLNFIHNIPHIKQQFKNILLLTIHRGVYHIWREHNDRRLSASNNSMLALFHKIKYNITSKSSRWKYGNLFMSTYFT